jgi:hypothetical protein|tara:strand:+ start:6093 stop:6557 length:465 start_codon:yes stop_codon:yes gene_type:complete
VLSKEELKEYNKSFWEEFRKRMRKHHSSSGRRMNWLNYPSDVKSIFIRLDVNKKEASVNFDVQFKDEEILDLVWEQLHEMRKIMENTMEMEAQWFDDLMLPNGQRYCRIQWKKEPCSYFDSNQHEEIYAFLEHTLIKFDEFYQEYKEIVINLVH